MTGIYLRSADGTMGKQLLDSIGVSTEFNLQRSVCMAETMKRDFFCDTGLFYPFLHRRIGHFTLQSDKHQAFPLLSKKGIGLIADGHNVFLLVFTAVKSR